MGVPAGDYFGRNVRRTSRFGRLRRRQKSSKSRGNPEFGAWRSLVAHLLWEQDVGGSNPLAPTMIARASLPARCGERTAMALARIYRPSKTAMQSGRAQARKWLLEYEPATRRDPDPLMGWASARDTLNEVKMRFPTLDEAESASSLR